MRRHLVTTWTLLLAAGFASAADKAKINMADGGLALQELRPLDRLVYVLTLEGKWTEPPKQGTKFYVNVLFPNGQAYSHRVLDDAMLRKGEVRCVIPNHLAKQNGPATGGKLTLVVSAGKPVTTANAEEVVSNAVVVLWPLDRAVTRRLVPSRFSPPEPIDAFPLPDPPPPREKPKTTPGGERELLPAPVKKPS